MNNPWLPGRRQDSQTVKFRLFCFAHAGGGSSFFNAWKAYFGPEIEVCPILLPGRESRIREKPYRRIEDIIEPLMQVLKPEMTLPFGVFGHSFGSILAFEVARRATECGYPLKTLMVSGRRAAHLKMRRNPLHQLDTDAFLKAIQGLNGTPKDVFNNEKLMDFFLPCLRADIELNETYTPLIGKLLSCTLMAFMGEEDTEVNQSELIAWRELTDGGFEHHIFAGDHFYLRKNPEKLLRLIKTTLSPYGVQVNKDRIDPLIRLK